MQGVRVLLAAELTYSSVVYGLGPDRWHMVPSLAVFRAVAPIEAWAALWAVAAALIVASVVSWARDGDYWWRVPPIGHALAGTTYLTWAVSMWVTEVTDQGQVAAMRFAGLNAAIGIVHLYLLLRMLVLAHHRRHRTEGGCARCGGGI